MQISNQPTIAAIFKAYERAADSGQRAHLGASEIGQACERKLWFSFRWAFKEKFTGRMLRLFDTGKLEEQRFIDDLSKVGIVVHSFDPLTGKQFAGSALNGHFAGSMDGEGTGFIAAPKTLHGLEFKTHNKASFAKIVNHGLELGKPEHYQQCQAYMGLRGLTRVFYMAKNKDDDDLYEERVYFDKDLYEKLLEKARRIIFADSPLPKIASAPEKFPCKMCGVKNQCHKVSEELPSFNCRTCMHSTPKEDGTWYCEHRHMTLTINDQRDGCKEHLYHPELMPWKQVDVTEDSIVYIGDRKNLRGGEVVVKPQHAA